MIIIQIFTFIVLFQYYFFGRWRGGGAFSMLQKTEIATSIQDTVAAQQQRCTAYSSEAIQYRSGKWKRSRREVSFYPSASDHPPPPTRGHVTAPSMGEVFRKTEARQVQTLVSRPLI
jgi:hypothetical protein